MGDLDEDDNPITCPATPDDPWPGILSKQATLINQGSFSPATLTNGYERSYTFTNVNAQCARIENQFSLGTSSSVDYKIEVQSLCFNQSSPLAVTLSNTQASPLSGNNNVMPIVAVVLFALTGLAVYAFRRPTQG
jgi:hypothetical protein